MAFNIGDRVTTNRDDSKVFVVEFGPFVTEKGSTYRYIIGDGEFSHMRFEHNLTPAPKFKAGDRVALSGQGDVHEVVHGPFETLGGNDRYLVKDPGGIHRFAGSEYMEPDLELQVGDRVRVLRETRQYEGNYAGETGTLKEIDTSDPTLPYYVTLDNGPMRWLYKVEKI